MWLSEKWASSFYGWANIGLITSLVVGVISTVLVVWTGNTKEEYLRRDLANTNERAAKAEDHAAQANLELAKLKAPRSLSSEQQKQISEKLRVFGGLEFDVALDPKSEPQDLLSQVEDALTSAGWKEIDWKAGNASAELNFVRKGRPAAGIAAVSGVIIQLHPERVGELMPVAEAIASALNAEGIVAKAEPGLGVPNVNGGAIHVLIGDKPTR
jgi:hypothetical protein